MQNSNPIEFLQNTDSDYLNTVHLRNKRLNYFCLQVWFSKCVCLTKIIVKFYWKTIIVILVSNDFFSIKAAWQNSSYRWVNRKVHVLAGLYKARVFWVNWIVFTRALYIPSNLNVLSVVRMLNLLKHGIINFKSPPVQFYEIQGSQATMSRRVI